MRKKERETQRESETLRDRRRRKCECKKEEEGERKQEKEEEGREERGRTGSEQEKEEQAYTYIIQALMNHHSHPQAHTVHPSVPICTHKYPPSRRRREKRSDKNRRYKQPQAIADIYKHPHAPSCIHTY